LEPQVAASQVRYHFACGSKPLSLDPLGGHVTRSEEVFIRYLNERAYQHSLIPRAGGSTPDFDLNAGGVRVIAEVKELAPNDEDRAAVAALKANKATPVRTLDGRRIRRAIEEAAKQLRTRSADGVPTMVIMYDNIIIDSERPAVRNYNLNADQIEWGMYGQRIVILEITGNSQIIRSEDRRGGQRQLTADVKTYVSAVGVLTDFPERCTLTVYHNYFAAVRLPMYAFAADGDTHFVKSADPLAGIEPWQQVVPR
jgi:hypothetical protein